MADDQTAPSPLVTNEKKRKFRTHPCWDYILISNNDTCSCRYCGFEFNFPHGSNLDRIKIHFGVALTELMAFRTSEGICLNNPLTIGQASEKPKKQIDLTFASPDNHVLPSSSSNEPVESESKKKKPRKSASKKDLVPITTNTTIPTTIPDVEVSANRIPSTPTPNSSTPIATTVAPPKKKKNQKPKQQPPLPQFLPQSEVPMINGGCPDFLPPFPTFVSFAEERKHRKRMLACAFRLFSKYGYDEGVAGHITVRDPEFPDTFWVNGFGIDFSEITVSNLIRCDSSGKILDSSGPHTINRAAYSIHTAIHRARPDVIAAAHSHSLYGKTWSTLGRLLQPITQDSCAFFEDHALYHHYDGVVFTMSEGERIAQALGDKKAIILQNHGLLTVGKASVEECIWWFISMEKCCKVQLLAEAASGGKGLQRIPDAAAKQAYRTIGTSYAGWYQCQMLIRRIQKECPDCLD